MRLSTSELGVWSFLMSSVHGAGLMLIPVLGHRSAPATVPGAAAYSLIHAAAMFLTAAVVALLVLELLGLTVLRRTWINLDRICAVALITADATTAPTT
jgi:hypothetical protein